MIIINESGEYGLRWTVAAGRNGRLTTKEKFFNTSKDREKFIDKISDRDDFIRIESTSDPRKSESLNKQDILRKLDKFQKTIRVDSKDEKELRKILDDRNIAYWIDDGSIPGKSTFQLDYDPYRKYK